jgi:16S rRNA (adenine1518-N6/adenine1519-N6)-dimethyltransferase
MVQDDVAARIVAPVGTKEYGALSVGVRAVAEVERLFKVGRKAFRPVPGVDSAMIRVRPTQPPSMSEEEEAALRHLVRAAFQWRRKQLGKILRAHHDLGYDPDVAAEALARAGAAPSDRPERLTPAQFVALAAALP